MKLTVILASSILLSSLFACGSGDKSTAPLGNSSGAAAPAVTPATSSAPPSSPDVRTQKNLLAFGAGAMVVDKTSESASAGGTDAARHLIDEAPFVWQTGEGQIENQSVTLELPARTTLQTIGFDTAQPTYYDHRAAKDVKVDVSDLSASEGFQTILSATLKDGTDNQNIPVERKIAGRFVRLTATNNHGSPKAILVKELRGYGDQEEPKSLENVSGTYAMEFYGEIHLKQEGTAIVGCYKYEQGLVTGGIEGRTLTLNWTQRANTKGFAVINFTDGGKQFLSAWWSGSAKSYDMAWKGEKKSDKVGNCDHLKTLDGENAEQNQLEKDLEEAGRTAVYGINFDFNSDKIKDESKPTVDKIVALLKKNMDWKMRVEGHTDNIGGESFNQTLSEKRGAAVKNHLASAGIDGGRLSSTGFGLSKPVATNETEAGRAQNRRVELVKQ